MLRSLIELKPRDVPLRVALRNTVAVIAPLAIGLAIDQVPAGLAMTTGALNTMFNDLPGPYRLRMRRMLWAALAAGLSALAGIAIGAHTALLIVVALMAGFGGGLLVALGPVAARTGLTSMIVLLVTADMRLPVVHAPGVAAMIFAGGLLQMLLALAAWPLQRYRPERFALATLLERLAEVARTRPDDSQAPPVSQASMDALALLHGEHRTRGVAAQSFRIIAELCERVRIDLLSLGDLHARIGDADLRARLDHMFGAAQTILSQLAQSLRDAEKPVNAEHTVGGFDALVEAIAEGPGEALDKRDRRLLRIALARAQGLAGQLRSLVRNSDWASSRGEIRAEEAEARLPAALRPGSPLQTLRANLSLSSVALRHAIRCGACLAIAVGCERSLQVPHGVWIPMTAAIVLKPDFGGTLRFGVLRVAGTFAGLLLTTLIAHFAMDGVALRLALMAVLCLGFRLLAQVNYGIGVAMLTGMLVLLLSFENIAPGAAIEMRIVGTLLGSALALTAYALWPTWEGGRVDRALAALIEAYRAHIAAVFAHDLAALYDTRGDARSARSNVQASIERLRAEPRRARAATRRAEALLANANRLIRASLSFEAVLRDGAAMPSRPELAVFAAAVDGHLSAIAQALRDAQPLRLPSLRPEERRLAEALDADTSAAAGIDATAMALADTADRIADSVDTLVHLLRPEETLSSPQAAVPANAG